MSFVTTTNRLLFSSQLFFAAFILIALGGLALGESAALSVSYRQVILSGTAGICVALAFAALVLELLERAERLESQARDLADAGEAVRASEARLLDFALTSSDWFWETDHEHRLIYTSEGIRLLGLGLDPDCYMGKSHWEIDVDAASEAERWRNHVALLARREVFRDVICTWNDDQNCRRNICISGRPVFDAAGRFHGYRGTARDVTEKLTAERQLHEAMRTAEQANVAKSNFLANIGGRAAPVNLLNF